MNPAELISTAKALVAPRKGILAADESSPTMSKRLAAVGVEPSAEMRRSYRELLFTAEGLSEYVSGVILYDETLRQSGSCGTPLAEVLVQRELIPGIKVDTGAKELAGAAGEKVTEGLDGLRGRLGEYREMGARFAKWRAVIAIGEGLPSRYCLETNAHALARYAALCQEQGIVPIVEPEVLMDGAHSLERCGEVTREAQHALFQALYRQGVLLEGIILKPNMVIAGQKAATRPGVDVVARETVRCLQQTVPAAVPGVAFLSGGQSDEEASAHLSAMNALGERLPWELSFSYGRALVASALQKWQGQAGYVGAAQRVLLHRAKCNGAAREGSYTPEMEQELAG